MSAIPTPFDNIPTGPQVPKSSAQVATPFDNIPTTQQAAPQSDPNEIPETSYGEATWGAVKNLASDTWGAIKGAGDALNPLPQDTKEKAIQQSIGGTGAMLMYRMAKSLGTG